MSISPIIEVAVGLALVYYILGLIVSFTTARVLEAKETRAQELKVYLKKIVGTTKIDDLLKQPQIQSLAPMRYDGWQGLFSGIVVPKQVEQIPVSNLVDAVFDIFELVDKQRNVDELKSLLGKLPQSDLKTSLEKLVDQGVTDINQFRTKASMRFTGLMDQVAACYKARARQWVILFSFLFTVLFGVDSIEFGTKLWQNAELRTSANAKAAFYSKQDGSTIQMGQLIKDLDELSLGITWLSAPANIPQTGATGGTWIVWLLLKVVGLGITTVAVSQGSSFWYDILRKLKGESTTPTDEST